MKSQDNTLPFPQLAQRGLSLQHRPPLPLERALPEERELVGRAVPGVQELFSAGRVAARAALVQVGYEGGEPILRGPRREPLWPRGFSASIAHTEGLALAIAGPKPGGPELGIDVEKIDRSLNPEISKKCCTEKERAWTDANTENLLRCLSAKEAIYKAFHQLDGRSLGFQEAELEPWEGGLRGRLVEAHQPPFSVLQTVWQGYLISLLCLETAS